jgi:hypothetical protein
LFPTHGFSETLLIAVPAKPVPLLGKLLPTFAACCGIGMISKLGFPTPFACGISLALCRPRLHLRMHLKMRFLGPLP